MKIKRILLGLLVAALVLTLVPVEPVAPPEAQAKSSGQIQGEIDKLEGEQDKIQKEMDSLNEKIEENMDEIERIVAEKNIIDQEIGLLNQKIQVINEQIVQYGLLIADMQDQLDLAQKNLDELTAKNRERIRAMEEAGGLSYWSVLFKANSFSDLLDRLTMIEEIASADRRRLSELREARAEVQAAQEELTAKKGELEVARKELEESQELLDKKRAQADEKLQELNERNEEIIRLLEKAEDEEQALLRQIAKLEKEYNDAVAKENAAAAPPPAVNGRPPASVTNGITWQMPCSYTRLSSPFGWRIHPVYGYRKFHQGVDLGAAQGTPIHATRSGTVTIAVYSSTAGYYVTINHGDGFSSVYMHMTHYIVSAGQKVSAGQVIGYVGSTGTSTGPHLHFGISYQGEYQNPADYLNFG